MKFDKSTTVADLLKVTDLPIVAIDQSSIFTFVNVAFTKEYGWTSDDLLGKSVVEIMPDHMRSAHNVGFARFLTTEHSELLNKQLPLKVKYKDGKEKLSNHFIVGSKRNGKWQFAAIIDYPTENG
ncbi:MAG: PAS domain S-box protein [Candidatus Saccharimonadales bacterium]